MIVFDLACPAQHVFEAWFGSTADFDQQQARGLVSCPVCGSGEVMKAVMAPNVAAKGNAGRDQARLPVRSGGNGGDRSEPMPAEAKAMLAALARAQARMLENSEHVGPRFAHEARAIHAGDAPERPIHGQATLDEARALVEEGVPVAPLPLPVVPPEVLQ